LRRIIPEGAFTAQLSNRIQKGIGLGRGAACRTGPRRAPLPRQQGTSIAITGRSGPRADQKTPGSKGGLPKERQARRRGHGPSRGRPARVLTGRSARPRVTAPKKAATGNPFRGPFPYVRRGRAPSVFFFGFFFGGCCFEARLGRVVHQSSGPGWVCVLPPKFSPWRAAGCGVGVWGAAAERAVSTRSGGWICVLGGGWREPGPVRPGP